MNQRVVLINPPKAEAVGDITGGGLYWPISLAILSEILSDEYIVSVVDMFSFSPQRKSISGGIIRYGLPTFTIRSYVNKNDIVIVYSGHTIGHTTVLDLISEIKKCNPKKILVVENTNYVNAYPLDRFRKEFEDLGAEIILGDPYDIILDAIDGNYDTNKRYHTKNVNSLPIPNWGGFNIYHYWDLPFAHAPKTNRKYIQMYTSFHCPGVCNFCVNPVINNSYWRPMSAEKVVREMKMWYDKGVKEFHVMDLNMSVDKKRVRDICKLIRKEKMVDLDIKVSTGLKLEYLDISTLKMMARAGFSYLSFSPESGSSFILYLMNKKFDHEKVLYMIKNMPSKIITQACFILGYPGETPRDIELTKEYAIKLAKTGVDEFAFFNFVPSIGSNCEFYGKLNTDDITFSSDWRPYNRYLRTIRIRLALRLYLIKLLNDPINVISRFFKTKTWMVVKRHLIHDI